MKKKMQQHFADARGLSRQERKTIRGGDLLPSNSKYECRVSQKGYTAGFVCVQQGQNPAKICERCYGVTYTVYVSPLLLCAAECLP